ncbi:MAG: hypothetical protein WDA09_07040, partial [Bacteriovoracaceae bacterium]
MSELRASIDIGSNSILLLIAEINAEGKVVEKEKLFHVTGLGKGVDKTGEFSEESMTLTYQALISFVKACKNYNIAANSIIATATEAARVAKNANAFFDKVRKDTGLNVHIISAA